MPRTNRRKLKPATVKKNNPVILGLGAVCCLFMAYYMVNSGKPSELQAKTVAPVAVKSSEVTHKYSIPQGMRLMSVTVDRASITDGLIKPESLVDVLLTADGETAVIAEKVKVISVAGLTDEGKLAKALQEAKEAKISASILLSQRDTLKVKSSSHKGLISFVLRDASDNETWLAQNEDSEKVELKQEKPREIQGYVKVKDSGKVIALVDNEWKPISFTD